MTESANSLSAAAGPELSTTRNPIANLVSDSATAGFAWVRVCVLWLPMTVLRHALFGDDFHQTPVSIILINSEKCLKFFSGFVGDATQVTLLCPARPSSVAFVPARGGATCSYLETLWESIYYAPRPGILSRCVLGIVSLVGHWLSRHRRVLCPRKVTPFPIAKPIPH